MFVGSDSESLVVGTSRGIVVGGEFAALSAVDNFEFFILNKKSNSPAELPRPCWNHQFVIIHCSTVD
jgi:hypothetical protein